MNASASTTSRSSTAQNSTAPNSTAPNSTSPFQDRFGRRMPRGFADEAAGLDWRTLLDTYAPSSDHFHLAEFSRRPLGRGMTAYEAILATRSPHDAPGEFTAHRLTTESCGDLTAMSEMLGQIGARVEIERFHQYEGHAFDQTESWCTILRATCGRRPVWAVGFGESSSAASIAALLSAATRLHLR
ncbi:hypothetical protein [Dietzia alimentaria]|uniref:hypothetical protein n=1 Tax=Dietzia alimentaria TaxID=665550 RepID=UPI00029B512B|nr:hypothetical protein [Dietzia alimentaria]